MVDVLFCFFIDLVGETMRVVPGMSPGLCTWWPSTELRPHLL